MCTPGIVGDAWREVGSGKIARARQGTFTWRNLCKIAVTVVLLELVTFVVLVYGEVTRFENGLCFEIIDVEIPGVQFFRRCERGEPESQFRAGG